MDEDTATQFVSSLVKSIQALCNGYIEFSSSIEVIGHIHLNIDRSMKLNYILTEEVSKSISEGATMFASHSYHSKPPPSVSSKTSNSKANRRKSQHVPRVDDSENDSLRITSLPRDISSVQPDGHSFGSSEASECDDSQTDNFISSQSSSPLLSVKPEIPEPASTHTRDNLDRRRRNMLTSSTTPPPAVKRSRTHSSDMQNTNFDVVEIKEEPAEEPTVYFGDSSSHQAAGQDAQNPDFNNVVIESLDRVSQVEGTQLVTGGSILQMQPQQHQQPFPVMLHATNTVVPSVPLPGVPVPGPSTESHSQATPSTSGDRKTRRTGVKTSKGILTRTLSKNKGTKASPRKSVFQSAGTSAKKSQEVTIASTSPKAIAGSPKKSLVSKKLTRTFNYKSGYREYTEEDMNEAIELIHGGMPVIDAALKYGIPRATLFNRSRDGCKTHSGRCSEVFARTHGGMSAMKKRQKNLQYTQESVEKAIEAIHQGMPVIDASILYRIPRASLFIRSARGCPSHTGRCATVYSNGKLRRTKAPKHKYLTLHKQCTPELDGLVTQPPTKVLVTSRAPAKDSPVISATPVTMITCKTEPDIGECTETDSFYSLQNKELQQTTPEVYSSGEASPEYEPLPGGQLLVKIERTSDSEI